MTMMMEQPEQAEISTLKERLISEIVEMYGTVADTFVRMAEHVKELDRLGTDWAQIPIPTPLIRRLRLLADGKLLPDTFKALYPNSRLLDVAARMSHAEQRIISENKEIPIARLGEVGGGLTMRAQKIPTDLWTQVFATDHIRDEEEQVAGLRRKESVNTKDPQIPAEFEVKKRLGAGAIVVKSGGIITLAQLKIAVEYLSG